jgi:hypothetical protein
MHPVHQKKRGCALLRSIYIYSHITCTSNEVSTTANGEQGWGNIGEERYWQACEVAPMLLEELHRGEARGECMLDTPRVQKVVDKFRRRVFYALGE